VLTRPTNSVKSFVRVKIREHVRITQGEVEMDDLIKPFRVALEALDRIGAERVFQQALMRMSPIQAVEQVVVPALEQVGTA